MKNVSFYLLLLFVSLSGALKGQTADTLSADVLFSQLDTSRIPTGILMDKAVSAGPQFYLNDGENPEAPRFDAYSALDNLWFLRQAAAGDTLVPKGMNLLDSAQNHLAREGNYPVVLADFNYNLIDSLAFDNNLLTLDDSVLVDGPDLSASPYNTRRFVAASILDSFFINSVSFVFEPAFFFSIPGCPVALK